MDTQIKWWTANVVHYIVIREWVLLVCKCLGIPQVCWGSYWKKKMKSRLLCLLCCQCEDDPDEQEGWIRSIATVFSDLMQSILVMNYSLIMWHTYHQLFVKLITIIYRSDITVWHCNVVKYRADTEREKNMWLCKDAGNEKYHWEN